MGRIIIRNRWTVGCLCLGLALGACKKSDDGDGDEAAAKANANDKSESGDKSGDKKTPDGPKKGKTLFDYPPKGDGPHKGYDLAAIREKLQGTWMVGGAAFSSIPHIWHVSGDELTKVGQDGKKTEHTIQLLAPCYAKVADKGASSATYVHFVFDGDTLYQGLGNSGLTDGKRSIGCMSAAVYVFDGGKCTAWTKKSFPRKGQPMFESAEGECGFSEDGKVFFGDDTNSKRKIYGRQELKQRVGNALMTRQMMGNKAEKMASLDAAMAKQKAAIDAKAEAKKPPSEYPFSAWKLPNQAITAESGTRMWAAASAKDGSWRLAAFRYKSATTPEITELSAMKKRWAPNAFIRPAAKAADFKKGMPVAYVTGIMLWGIVDKVEGEQVTMSYLSGRTVKQKTAKAEMFLAFEKGKRSLGAPVTFMDGEMMSQGQSVLEDGDTVYVLHQKDGKAAVSPLKAADVKLVDGYKAHKRGAKILVRQPSGFSPLKWVPGKVTKVHAKGAAYDVTTDDGKKYTQHWAFVTKK